jgi:hypothetical protein
MTGRRRILIVSAAVLAAAAVAVAVFLVFFRGETVVEYRDPEPPADELFADDPVPEKPPGFDPELVDSRKLEGWEINKSAAVIRLDVRPVRPGVEAHLEKIYPTYARAVDFGGREVIPSVSLLDAKCKQLDDALYAAVDLAAFNGVKGRLAGIKDVLARLRARLKPGKAADFVDAALLLSRGAAKPGGKDGPGKGATKDIAAGAQALVDRFLADGLASRPTGFYDWTPELQTLYRTERFLAAEFDGTSDAAVAQELAEILRTHAKLREDYRKTLDLFHKLTNRPACLALDELPAGELTREVIAAEARRRGRPHPTVSFLPPSTSRENELVERLGLAPEADLMRELVRRIRSGEINLAPREGAGWYEHQVWALETLLLPGRGQEKGKLIFSARYKQRMLESFKAQLTRRRDTHARQLPAATSPREATAPPARVAPRLRLEPAPTYCLRTARAYGFVANLLKSVFGTDLEDIYGLRQTWTYGQIRRAKLSERDDDLATELTFARRLFYGLYLVSCEDLGLRPEFAPGEEVDAAACRQAALNYVQSFRRDPDLAPDARVLVPVVRAPGSARARYWAVVGVRLARLEAEYVHPPSLRAEGGDWQPVRAERLDASQYLIPVDAFASFVLEGAPLTRREFWDVLGAAGTRDGFLKLVRENPTREALLRRAAEILAESGDEGAAE